MSSEPVVKRSRLFPSQRAAWPPAGDPDWCDWARRHGIDPDAVSLTDPIVCDDKSRTISYLTIHDVPGGTRTELVRLQLESPAAPFPGGDPA